MEKYVFEYSGTTYEFEKEPSDKDKYVVFACAKNEDNYIKEWVEHNLSVGFDKVIIADNNDEPGKLEEILSEYVKNGTVQIFPCNGLKRFQTYIYNMYLNESNYKWCAYFDCDEFIEFNSHKDVKDFLEVVKEECVLVNWVVFGSNEKAHNEGGFVQDRFKFPVSPLNTFKENFYVKPIIRGGATGFYMTNTHCPNGKRKTFNVGGYHLVDNVNNTYYPPRCKYAYIKHYYTKSFDEWIANKVRRGWPDEMFDLLKPANYFIVDKNYEFPIERYTSGFFVDNNEFEEKRMHEQYDDMMNNYEVIVVRSSDDNIYSLVLHVMSFMRYFTNHIILIDNKQVDDALFNLFLEYSFKTGNRVAFAFNQWDIDRTVLYKTKWNSSKYYYMDCQ